MLLLKKYIFKRKLKKINFTKLVVKGLYGAIVIRKKVKIKVNKKVGVFKKYIMHLLKKIKQSVSLWRGIIGIIGRGMGIINLKRGIYRGVVGLKKKRAKKYVRKFLPSNLILNLKKKKEERIMKKKKKQSRRKKKKAYTKQVRFKNKLFIFKRLFRRTITRLGERGHVSFKRPQKLRIKFKRLNTLYKCIFFFGVYFYKKENRLLLHNLLTKKPFGPYKVKGLKFLNTRGVTKEGKSRKF